MIYAYRTDKGVRPRNEDCCRIPEAGERPLVIVADGMGGHKSGDVASQSAVRLISSYASQAPVELGCVPMLRQAIAYANRSIFESAQHDYDRMGMGTTVVVALLEPTKYTAAHIGDSRLYHFKTETQRLSRVTRDHSYVQELVTGGFITEEQAQRHPQRNILTRAVGTSGFEKADVSTKSWHRGDRLLLCTDGLCGYVSDAHIESVMRRVRDPLACCDALTELALSSGSADNITVVIVENEGAAADGR